MSLYLSFEEIKFYEGEIREEFTNLITHRWFSARKNSKQWLFFKHCFQVLFLKDKEDYPCTENQAIQYKYEINDRLNRYYLSFGKPIKFVFSLVHGKNDGISQYEEADYPICNNYLLRVSYNQSTPDTIKLKRLLIEKTITEAMDAEWNVYSSLPELNISPLSKVFDEKGEAYKKIYHIARGNQLRNWTLNNENNPSTKRLVDIKIEKMTETTAQVRTSEYWLLYWWSAKSEKYEHTYKELNRQRYFLSWKNNQWFVIENIYPPARLSTPRRNIRASEIKK